MVSVTSLIEHLQPLDNKLKHPLSFEYSLTEFSLSKERCRPEVMSQAVETKPPTQRQQQALARRGQILGVALKLFAKQGFAATATKQIAREAGIAEGLIFHYFPTKADLLKAIAKERRTFAGELTARLREAEEHPARECLRELAEAWIVMVHRESSLFSTIISESFTNASLQDAFQEILGGATRELATYLAARVRAGELRPDLPVHESATAFLSPLMLFFILHHQLSDTQWEAQAKPFVEGVLDHWFRGALNEKGA